MSKFHINANGDVGICRAQHSGKCPFGGESEHFSTSAEARSYFERKSSIETFTKLGKDTTKTESASKPFSSRRKEFAEFYRKSSEEFVAQAKLVAELFDNYFDSPPKSSKLLTYSSEAPEILRIRGALSASRRNAKVDLTGMVSPSQNELAVRAAMHASSQRKMKASLLKGNFEAQRLESLLSAD